MTVTLRKCVLFTALLSAGIFCIHTLNGNRIATGDAPGSFSVLAPWANIGGCGASSGSVSMDMQLKWIGRGVSGGLFDAEALYINAGVSGPAYQSPDVFDGHLSYRSNAVLLNLFYHPRFLDFKLGLPLVMKTGYNTSTGLLGDMSLDITKKWLMQGNLRSALTFTLPTGRYDIYTSQTACQPEMQLGSGTINGGVRFDYTIDKDWGLITLGTSYSAGLWGMRTKTWEYDQNLVMPLPAEKGLASARFGWGSINDVGTVQPDMFSLFGDIGFKMESMMHGICLSYSAPTRNGSYEDRPVEISSWDNNDPTNPNYAPTIELAQKRADTSLTYAGKNPLVTTTNAKGEWVVLERQQTVRSAFPGLTLQYSVEKSDSYVPLLFGAAVRMDYNNGFNFAAFGAGVGFKFNVY